MKTKIEIDTQEAGSPDKITVGWFSIIQLNKIKAVIRQEEYSQHDKRIYLFGRHKDCSRNGAQIFVHLFDLPQDQAQFDKEYGFYKTQQKNFFLTDKKKFDNSVLNLANISSDLFVHEAFQTRDGKYRRRIVHLYKNDHIALLIIYSLDTIELKENSFFDAFANNAVVHNY